MKIRLLTAAFMTFVTFATQAQGWQIGGGSFGNSRQETAEQEEYTPTYNEDEFSYDFFKDAHPGPSFTLSVGYVNKDWVTDIDGDVRHENFWGERGKRLHGIQIGGTYEPYNKYGLGFRTGLFVEVYLSFSNESVKKYDYDDYTETGIYVPAQLMYRIPLGDKANLKLFGGVGFNWAFVGVFSEDNYFYDRFNREWVNDPFEEFQSFGHGYYPKRFNPQAEFGVDVTVSKFKLGFTYSHGLRNHDLYQHAEYRGYKTRQDKLAFNVGFSF